MLIIWPYQTFTLHFSHKRRQSQRRFQSEALLKLWMEENEVEGVAVSQLKYVLKNGIKKVTKPTALAQRTRRPPAGSFTILIWHSVGTLPTHYLSFIIIIHFHCYCPPWKGSLHELTKWEREREEKEKEQWEISVCVCVLKGAALTNWTPVRKSHRNQSAQPSHSLSSAHEEPLIIRLDFSQMTWPWHCGGSS